MRMRDLVRESGLPRTTIHHYLREELLPPPEKTAENAAVYGEPHLRRLALLKALRGPELGPLSLEEIRSVLPLVEAGHPPAAAVALAALGRRAEEESAGRGRAPGGGAAGLSDRELARRSGLDRDTVGALREAGALRPPAGGDDRGERGAPWGLADLAAATACATLLTDGRLEPPDLRPVVELFEEIGRYEEVLLEVARSSGAGEAETGLRGAFHDLHTYLLARTVGG